MPKWIHPADRPRNKKLLISESQRPRLRRTTSRRRRQLLMAAAGLLLIALVMAYATPGLLGEIVNAVASLLTPE